MGLALLVLFLFLAFPNVDPSAISYRSLFGSPKIVAAETPQEETASRTNTQNLYNISVVTWNLAEKSPSARDCAFLKELQSESDFVVVGVQELEDIRPRRTEGHRTKKWRATLKELFSQQYVSVAQHKMGGMQISVYAKKRLRGLVRGVQVVDVACGIGQILANKGAVGVVLRMRSGKTLALVNAHLAAHQNKVKERNADFHRIVSGVTAKTHKKWLKKRSAPLANAAFTAPSVPAPASGKKKPRRKSKPSKPSEANALVDYRGSVAAEVTVEEQEWANPFDGLVFFGDLNYRMDLPRLEIEEFDDFWREHPEQNATPSKGKSKRKGKGKGKGRPKKSEIKKNRLEKDKEKEKEKEMEKERGCTSESGTRRNQYVLHSDGEAADVRTFQLDMRRLLMFDQLTLERARGRAFDGFAEGTIVFPPSFKYDRGSDRFDSSAKQRCPAWTDRVLFAVAPPVQATAGDGGEPCAPLAAPLLRLLDYYSVAARSSDHRPVCAQFSLSLD